ncbi:5-oxoprolinase subunit PxpA [Paraneptunicella aestuarii]|uniref:5-oxoprolinase subunit PxpA n=1 Tax=Paraneptunicella aestuarii TaxID=2831148 RepID=UPI001E5D5A30|nr:5-oxoprolinase subunit PxpA [Paraneptunicella aestuarii]UAA37281.1 5-oxoprolinase subunit PxpA [Paraneptunicella aestuarii]
MQINCDLGESFGAWSMGHDEAFMELIDLANIACGYHAGDPSGMRKTLSLAMLHNVSVGAHPAYPDLQGFGRRSMNMAPELITDMLLYQIAALDGMAHSLGTKVSYVKPHGALYNDMMVKPEVLDAVAKAINEYHRPIKLMVQSLPENNQAREIASRHGVELMFEAFADRLYTDAGLLASRQIAGAVLHIDEVEEQVKRLKNDREVKTQSGKLIPLEVDSICIHSDGEGALAKARIVHQTMKGS